MIAPASSVRARTGSRSRLAASSGEGVLRDRPHGRAQLVCVEPAPAREPTERAGAAAGGQRDVGPGEIEPFEVPRDLAARRPDHGFSPGGSSSRKRRVRRSEPTSRQRQVLGPPAGRARHHLGRAAADVTDGRRAREAPLPGRPPPRRRASPPPSRTAPGPELLSRARARTGARRRSRSAARARSR